jgi:hypothetical protein
MINDQDRTKLKAGYDMKIVHSKSKCGNIKGDAVSIRRPSSDGSVSYVETFSQRKQSSEANTYGSISILKVDEFGRAEKFSRVENDENGLEVEKLGRAENGRDRQEVEVTERTGSVTANAKVTKMACD